MKTVFALFLSDILLSIIPSISIHVVVNGIISFFFMAECYSTMYTPHLYPSFVDGHLDYLHVLAIVNNASMMEIPWLEGWVKYRESAP